MPSEERAAALAEVSVEGRQVALRPMTCADIEASVSYWHDGGADLRHLGIDPVKLGSRGDTEERFKDMVSGARPRQVLGFTITVDERAVGYVNVNVVGRPLGSAHFHLVDPPVRRIGVMSAILELGLAQIVARVRAESEAEGLVVEVRTRNAGMNRVLERLGHRPVETRYRDDPDGLAGPGSFISSRSADREHLGSHRRSSAPQGSSPGVCSSCERKNAHCRSSRNAMISSAHRAGSSS